MLVEFHTTGLTEAPYRAEVVCELTIHFRIAIQGEVPRVDRSEHISLGTAPPAEYSGQLSSGSPFHECKRCFVSAGRNQLCKCIRIILGQMHIRHKRLCAVSVRQRYPATGTPTSIKREPRQLPVFIVIGCQNTNARGL